MTVPGQTDEYTISDHLNAIKEHCGEGMIDYCIYDTGEIIPEFIKKYNREGADIVEQDINVAKSKFKGIKFLQRNLSIVTEDYVRHDPNLLASSIIELICDDLRYQDKQNDPEYMMMNTKLRADKEINKKKKATERANKRGKNKAKPKSRGKSKFSNKYSERIASIKDSENTAKRKTRQAKEKKSKTTKNEKIVNTKLIPDLDVKTTSERSKLDKNKEKKHENSTKRMKTIDDIKAEMEQTLKNSKLGK